MVHGALSETLLVTRLVLSLSALGDMLVHLLLETTCSVLKYLVPEDSSNAYRGTGNFSCPEKITDEVETHVDVLGPSRAQGVLN